MNYHGRWNRLRGILLLILPLLMWMGLGFPPLQKGDAGTSAAVQQDSTGTTLYLPLVITPPRPPSDLEITQTVQQPGNPVTLITGRPTFVRYTLTSETAYSGVNAYLYGYRDGFPLPGSPLSAINNPRTLETVANRADINDTFNFELPGTWTSGTVSLWGAASNGTTFEIVEGPSTAEFLVNDPLAVTIVPIAYTCTSGGAGTVTPASPYDYLVDHTFKVYPIPSINFEVHAPVVYSGPCTSGKPDPTYVAGAPYDDSDWERLLNLVTTAWQSEGFPNRYFYGLVNSYCGSSCIAGLGWIGAKAAVGWNGSGSAHSGASTTHAHEVGHNHGRSHAPGCGAGSPDLSYPYSSGYIGDGGEPNFGFDVLTYGIKPYASYFDLMGYCSNEWISDYTYEALYAYEAAQPAIAADALAPIEDVLLISGWLEQDGSVKLMPAFRLELPYPQAGTGPYTLQLVDAAGQILAEQPFRILTAAADGIGGAQGGVIQGFQLTISYTPGIEQIRVLKDGQVLGNLRAKTLPPALALAPAQAQIEKGRLHATWDGPVGASYLVRLSLDGGATWQTVGVNLDRPALDLPLQAAAGADVRLEILASDGIHTQRLELGPGSFER